MTSGPLRLRSTGRCGAVSVRRLCMPVICVPFVRPPRASIKGWASFAEMCGCARARAEHRHSKTLCVCLCVGGGVRWASHRVPAASPRCSLAAEHGALTQLLLESEWSGSGRCSQTADTREILALYVLVPGYRYRALYLWIIMESFVFSGVF